MLKRIPTLKGLNLRDSDINRPPDYAQDCRNVEKNSKGEVVLRWGYDQVNTDADIIDLFEYVGAEDDPDRGSLLALKANNLCRLNGTSLDPINNSNVAGQPVWSEKTKPVEYNKVLYWNDPSGEYDLWKFDGYSTYRAGVPKPSILGNPVFSGTAGTYYFRVLIKYFDPQGNVTYSDYEQFKGTSDAIEVTFNPITHSDYNGFYQKYCEPASTLIIGSYIVINSGNLTLDLDPLSSGGASHNYVSGDYMLLTTGYFSGDRKIPVLISSVTATTITFDSSSVGSNSFVLFGASNEPAEYRYEIEVYRSEFEFSNYIKIGGTTWGSANVFGSSYALGNQSSSFSETFDYDPSLPGATSKGANGSNPQGTPLESVYDSSLVRVLPPKGKYLTLYGEQVFIGNLIKNQEDFGYASILANDSRLEDSIVWSDVATLSNGSSVETFLVNNIRSIGNSEDGALVGLHGNDDNLAVHKEKQSYYVNGDFISNNLRIRRAMTEQIGTASHRSIRTVEGGHLYASPKGIYLSVGGQRPTELSDLIEPLFTDNALELLDSLNTKDAKTITDFLREKMYIFIPYTTVDTGGIVLGYDYYHKDWFVHDNIPADRGFQDVGISSTDIYFADKDGLYRRNLNSRKDNDKKTVGYYWTGWFDLEIPSIVKKFTNFILLSIAKKDFTATIKGYCNWQKDTEESSNTVELTDKISSEDTQVLQAQANSVSYRISNESNGSDLHITSYEVEYEPTQTKPKGTV